MVTAERGIVVASGGAARISLMEDHTAIVDRVSRLERSLRSAHRLAGCLAVALCFLVLVAAMQDTQDPPRKELRVQKLIVDTIQVGKQVTFEGEGGSAVLSRTGLMVVSKLGGIVVGSNFETGACYVKLLKGRQLDSGSTMVDAASLGINTTGAALLLGDKDNSVMLASDDKRGSIMMFADERGQDRVRLTVSEGGAVLQMKDAAGAERVTLGSQVLQGADGKPLRLPESGFTLWDEVGRCVHRAGTK